MGIITVLMTRNRSTKLYGRLLGGFCVLVATVGGAVAQDTEVLDNGLVHLAFSPRQGTFEAHSLAGGPIRLLAAGPALQVNGLTVSVADVASLEVRRDGIQDQLGPGQKLVILYEFKGHFPRLRYELTLYRGQPWISATAYIPAGDYKLGDISLVQGQIRTPGAFKARIYVNSGRAGGDSGVWELGMRRWISANLSTVYIPEAQDALSLGFYSFYRAGASVISQYLSSSVIGVNAVAHYNGYQPNKAELRTESVLLTFGTDPLRMLENWADVAVKTVQPKFLHDTRTSFINTWYAFGDKATDSLELEQAKILRQSPLYGYGVRYVELGEWQKQRNGPGDSGDALGYGEDKVDETLFPQGLTWLCGQYHNLGFGCSYGANYAYAALSTSTVKRNPPWLIKEDLSRLDFGYPIDFTHPDAQKWVYDLYRRAVDIGAKWVWSDFDGGPALGKLYDSDKVRGFEDIREGMKAIRMAVGIDTFIHKFCCGSYFSYIGLADRVRTGQDMVAVGDWARLKDVARQMAATYMLHQRFWINDPDPLFVGAREYVHNYGADTLGPDPATLDEVRMRLQLHASTGGFLTLGENLKDYTAEKIRLLTLVLPSYGQAARPLDLFIHNTPEMYDLDVSTDWERWHVLMLQNWNDDERAYTIRFPELGLDESKSYLVFRFWDQALLGAFRRGVQLHVAGRQGETYAVRELPDHPWVLSTNMHITQGGVELEGVKYDPSIGRLSGIARRHRGAEGSIVLYIPVGYRFRASTLRQREESHASGAKTVTLPLKFDQETAPWSADFDEVQ